MALFRKALTQLDLFPAQTNLRLKGQTQKMNIFSGLISSILYLLFVALFIYMMINILQYNDIKATINTGQNSSNILTDIPFAVGIIGMNLSEMSKLITIQAFNMGESQDSLPLKPCKQQLLPGISLDDYQEMKLDQYLCAQNAKNIKLYSFFMNPNSKYLQIQITPCNSQISGSQCQSPEIIEQALQYMVSQHGSLIASFIPLTTGFNPTQKQATFRYTYKDTFYLQFTHLTTPTAVVFFNSYTIESDSSILPFSSSESTNGHYVDRSMILYNLRTQGKSFMQAYIFASPTQIKYQRVFGKIDEVFSYIGGLFGILISIAGIFMMSFNEYKYQLEIGENNCSGITNQKASQKSMNFIKYVKYTIFDWFNLIFCCQLKWRDCKAIQEVRQQAISQLDACQLLRRISSLQRIVQDVHKQQDVQLIYYMTKPDSLSKMARNRKIKNYIDKMRVHQNNYSINQLSMLKNQQLYAQKMELSVEVSLPLSISNQQNEDSQSLIQKYVNKYLQICLQVMQQIDLSQDDVEASDQLLNIFEQINQNTKRSLIKDIPIAILYHLYMYKSNKQNNGTTQQKFGLTELKQIKIYDMNSET